MHCRAASVGAILQVVGMALGAAAGSPLAAFAGPVGGLVAGTIRSDPDDGVRTGLRAGAMGVAGFALSLGTLAVLGGLPATVAGVPPLVGVALVVLTVLGAGAGGAVGGRLRRTVGASAGADPVGEGA